MNEHGFYAIWEELAAIADSLRDLGFKELASKVFDPALPREILDTFLNLVQREASKQKRHDVLERLCFAGLIYG